MAYKICFFNHKGGVSKTTNVYHIGWMLANLGKRVLFVDADSQCNLTSMILAGDGVLETFFKNEPERNLKSALSPAFYAKPEKIKPFDCVPVDGNDSIFLIPGSFDITEYESSLAVSFQLSNTFTSMRNLPGAFNYLIEETAKVNEIDYVLIDMNPSLSAFNQDILVSSDFFLVPVMPDFFSVMAIRSLSEILPRWGKWAEAAKPVFKNEDYPLPQTTPKFLGYTINNFTVRKGKPAGGYDGAITQLNEVIANQLIPKLSKSNMILKQEDLATYCLGEISDFNTLISAVQQSGTPVFEFTETNLKTTGIVKKTQQNSVDRFSGIFKSITEKILNLVEHESSYSAVPA